MKTQTFSLLPGGHNHLRGWADAPPSVAFAFGDPDALRMRELFEQLAAAYPEAVIIGCSTAGEILGDSVLDGTLTGAVAAFDKATVRAAHEPVTGPADSYRAGVALGARLAREDLRAVIVLSEGIHVNGSELVRGLDDALGSDVVVTGGLAADGNRFGSTWVYADGGFHRDVVAGVGLYGDVRVGHGSRGGWDIFGPVRTVTASDGNVVYEIDDQPALALYKRYLGELAAGLPGTALLFPLAIYRGEDASTVRTILGVDEERQSLTFAGDVPAGTRAQLMRANYDRLIDGAAGAALGAVQLASAEEPVLSLAISCVGRRLVLGLRAEEELESALRSLPRGSHQIGFYSYGELSPLASGRCELHNQTMTVTSIWEQAA